MMDATSSHRDTIRMQSIWSRVIRQAYSDAPTARFMLDAGDLLHLGDTAISTPDVR
jgi:hypothetical protein